LSGFAIMGLAGEGHRVLAGLLPWGSEQRRYRRLRHSLQEAIRCGITTVVEPQSGQQHRGSLAPARPPT
jgi:hypothetical protein